jgi:AraC family transcriptional regulator
MSDRRLMRALAYIDAHVGDPITLADLAATAGLSRMYFARRFRAATGIRPHEYVLRRRVERAQELLTATSGPVVDIALSVGFQTQAHFTTVFRKIVGNTPRQWRREQAATA